MSYRGYPCVWLLNVVDHRGKASLLDEPTQSDLEFIDDANEDTSVAASNASPKRAAGDSPDVGTVSSRSKGKGKAKGKQRAQDLVS